MGPVLSQALEQILGLAVSHLPRSLEIAQLQPACLDEMLKDIVHGDWMSRLLPKPACDLVQLFVNVLADPYCSHCRQRHNVTSAIKRRSLLGRYHSRTVESRILRALSSRFPKAQRETFRG